MTTEELLKPRYKVIADWPDNLFNLGDILIESDIVEDWVQTDNFLHGLNKSSVDKYPHLFCRLEWWEERKPEDMPKYIKWGDNVGKLGDIFSKNLNGIAIATFPNENGVAMHLSEYEPATEEEYLNQSSNQIKGI